MGVYEVVEIAVSEGKLDVIKEYVYGGLFGLLGKTLHVLIYLISLLT